MKISILDCTLRDGGYVNNFNFGVNRIHLIKEKLRDANIEIIECGFLQSGKNDPGRTLYGRVEQIQLPQKRDGQMYVAMITHNDIGAAEVAPYQPGYVDGLRLSFHNHGSEWEDTKCLARKMMDKGYKVFIQPVGTAFYTDEELLKLIKDVNELDPFAFYIVDTLGSMYKNDLLRKFFLVEHNLNKNICLGFHSHNNMQLSFANAMTLLELHTDRHIILDSSVFGMGRGAGNLNTELIAHFINSNIDKRYDLVPILELIDDAILPIYKYTPWGFSEPYYLSAIMGVHPNHASYLIDKQSVGMAKIFDLLGRLPVSNRHIFVKQDIEKLYHAEMANNVEDSAAIEELSDKIRDRDVLVIAPGGSVRTHSDTINKYIKSKRPFVVSLNFVPDGISPDLVFVSNRKRFEQLGRRDLSIAVTSNVNAEGITGAYVINYDSLIHGESDSSGIMVLGLLIRLGAKHATLAGYDGFTVGSNHYNESLDNYMPSETAASLNNSMHRRLREVGKILPIEFITPSVYKVKDDD